MARLNTNSNTSIKSIVNSGKYPLIESCLGKYIEFVLNLSNLREFDIIRMLEMRNGLQTLESLLKRVLLILGMGCQELVRSFGLKTDLISKEPEKFYDIFNEFVTIVKLHEKHFKGFKKIKPRKKDGIRVADFVACYRSNKYAIEIKTIRESEIEERARIRPGLAYKVDTLKEMLEDKLKDILHLVKNQLDATARKERCRKKLFAIWIRRKAALNLLNLRRDDYGQIYNNVKKDFPSIDYFLFNGNNWYPQNP